MPLDAGRKGTLNWQLLTMDGWVDYRDVIGKTELTATVIWAHLDVEQRLIRCLQLILRQPHELELERLSFGIKVDLLVSLGLLPSEGRGLFLGINRIRNRFAHRRTAAITSDDLNGLQGVMSERQKDVFGGTANEQDSVELKFASAIELACAELFLIEETLQKERDLAEVYRDMWKDRIRDVQVPTEISAAVAREIEERLSARERK